MNFYFYTFLCLLFLSNFFTSCSNTQETNQIYSEPKEKTEKGNRLSIKNIPDKKRVEVLSGEKLFTAYIYPDNLEKPVLFPINSVQNTPVTRGFPIAPRPNERIDHPHHVGLWFNHGDVNNLDFWNNSYAIPEERKHEYGSIRHISIDNIESEGNTASLKVTSEWVTPDSVVLITENTTFNFQQNGETRTIERITQLTAEAEVTFEDSKEGVLGIRVARELEEVQNKPIILTDENGIPSQEPISDTTGVNGMYRSSNGEEKEAGTWGKPAKWMSLSGKIQEDIITLAIFDHPKNPNYPTRWMSRGYGLFSANSLGDRTFTKGEKAFDLKLVKGESSTFRHLVVIHSGETSLSDQVIETLYQEFVAGK